MARPTPKDNARRALFGWLTGTETEKWAPATKADLPAQVRALIAFRQADYIPNAETWVFEEDERVAGFVAILGNEVGAIFVDPNHQRKGIGRA